MINFLIICLDKFNPGYKGVLSFIMLQFLTFAAYPQTIANKHRIGLPFTEVFSSADYDAHVQTFSATQGMDGRMYFANVDAICIYNGETWQKQLVQEGRLIKSLAAGPDGTIYYGGSGDIGYLTTDAEGNLKSISLLDHFPDPNIKFSNVWDISLLGEDVYFMASNVLMRWAHGKISVWDFPDGFQSIGVVQDSLYFQSNKGDIYVLQNDKFRTILSAGKVNSKIRKFIDPQRNGEILLVTEYDAIKVLKDGTLHDFTSGYDDIFTSANKVYDALIGPDNNLFIASIYGVFVFSLDGELVAQYKKDLLGNVASYALYFDNQGNLWVPGNKAITKLEYASPIRYLGKENGIEGNVNNIIKFDNKIYISTSYQVQYLDLNSKNSFVLQKVEGIDSQSSGFAKFGDQLLIATQKGIFSIKGKKAVPVKELALTLAYSITQSKLDTSRIFIGSAKGLHTAVWNGSMWVREKDILENQSIFKIIETKKGNLWASSWESKAIRINLTYNTGATKIQSQEVKYFDSQGLPTLISYDQDLYTFTLPDNQIAVYDKEHDKLVNIKKVPGFEDLNEKDVLFYYTGVYDIRKNLIAQVISEDGQNNYFIKKSVKNGQEVNSKISIDILDGKANSQLYEDDHGLIWFAGFDGIFIYDEDFENRDIQLTTNVTRVVFNQDSVIYGGFQPTGGYTPKLPYRNNSITFDYAVNSFSSAKNNYYQYILEGYDTKWSKLTQKPQKEYTNLHEGDYVFKVMGYDINNNASPVANFQFTILPPWYRTWWMYSIYLAAIIGLLVLIDKFRHKKVVLDKKRLEAIVTERTKEVHEQAQKLETQTEKLKELDRLKSQFFANISHEFRTPITLIQGPLERMLGSNTSTVVVQREQLESMNRNSKRLQFLVNQLLDLVSLDAGNLGLHIVFKDLLHFIRSLAHSFSSLAETKNIEYTIEVPQDSLVLPFDTDAVEKILYNILTNAFKFTPQYGRVQFTFDLLNSKKERLTKYSQEKPAFLKAVVSDSGEGIPSTMINRVFERFTKNEKSYNTGVGIGLSLVKELVDLYNGQLRVESEPGAGSTFEIILPVDIKLFNPGAIKSVSEFDSADSISSLPIDLNANPDLFEQQEPAPSEGQPDAPVILVIEDNRDIRQYLIECLQHSYNIKTARNGKEGLEIIKEEVPDLVVSDIMMPEMSGIEFLRLVKEDEITSHIPVILLTAKADEQSRLEGFEHGADAYLIKPFSDKELLIRIRKLIEQRKKLINKFTQELVLKPTNVKVQDRDELFIRKVIDSIEENIDNTTFGVADLQSILGVSRMQLHRKLSALTGKSATEFIKYIRLVRAEQLLRESKLRVSEVGYAVGFSDPSYFSKCFKEQFGVPPSDYSVKS